MQRNTATKFGSIVWDNLVGNHLKLYSRNMKVMSVGALMKPSARVWRYVKDRPIWAWLCMGDIFIDALPKMACSSGSDLVRICTACSTNCTLCFCIKWWYIQILSFHWISWSFHNCYSIDITTFALCSTARHWTDSHCASILISSHSTGTEPTIVEPGTSRNTDNTVQYQEVLLQTNMKNHTHNSDSLQHPCYTKMWIARVRWD